MSDQGLIDLYYGDECRVSLNPSVPYAWQFADEEVFMPTSQGQGLNCFALINRANTLLFETTTKSVNSALIVEQPEQLSYSIGKETVVVLDNAKPHTAKAVQERRPYWQQRGLTLFYLPPYSQGLRMYQSL